MVGLFDQVVTDFGVVIEHVNHKFGTHFALYRPTGGRRPRYPARRGDEPPGVQGRDRLETQLATVVERVGRKKQTSALLNREAKATLLASADELYHDYVSLAKAQAAE